MSKDIKELSDSAEKNDGSLRTLKKAIVELQNDNKLLKERIEEQNSLIKEKLKSYINDLQDIKEIKILKEMIVFQRQELSQKEKEIKHLEDNVIDLTEEIKKFVVIENELKDTTLLENAHQSIDNLLSEKTDLENQVANLTNKFINLEKQNEILLSNLEKAKTNQDIIFKLETKIDQLKSKITELEKENTSLREKGGTLNTDEEYTTKLEDKIVEYDEIISNLEEKNKSYLDTLERLKAEHLVDITKFGVNIESAQKIISKLKEENKNLHQKVTSSKDDQLGASGQNISELRRKINNMEKDNRDLNEKNELLKAALLLHVDSETKDAEDFTKGVNAIQIPKAPKKASKITNKVEQVKTQEQIAKISHVPDSTSVKEISSQNEEPSKDKSKNNITSTEGRRLCPQCGNRNLRLIREIEDKTKIISTYPRIYGKKYKCSECGFEWH
jgi:chromosome segregation ATPase